MEVKEDYLKLKERWILSDGAERKRVEAELDDFFDSLEISDNMQLEETINEDFKRIHQKLDEAKEIRNRIQVRKKLEPILPYISVSALAKKYFDRSSSWFYQRLNGNVVHSKPAIFTENELKTLEYALQDIAKKLVDTAELLNDISILK